MSKPKYLIEIFDNETGKRIAMFKATHVDASTHLTTIESYETSKPVDYWTVDKLTRINIESGLITLHYDNGTYLEISKIRENVNSTL